MASANRSVREDSFVYSPIEQIGDHFHDEDQDRMVLVHILNLGIGSAIIPMHVREVHYIDNNVFQVIIDPRMEMPYNLACMRDGCFILFVNPGDPYEVIITSNARKENKVTHRGRKSNNYEAKEDAYADPAVAAMAEFTTDGTKTRAGFYKREK